MITITHPKVTTKPPINKLTLSKKSNNKNVNSTQEDKEKTNNKFINDKQKIECSDCTADDAYTESTTNDLIIDNIFKNIEKDVKHLTSTSDCNQNVIQTNSCAFDQLCSMINDLEQNIIDEHEIVNIETSFLPGENNVSCQIKYIDQVNFIFVYPLIITKQNNY